VQSLAYTRASEHKEVRMSAAEEQDARDIPLPRSTHEPLVEESLTDVIDQLSRKAFRRSLERRHTAPAYREVLESPRLVRTPST
jgi:hypothetical protein